MVESFLVVFMEAYSVKNKVFLFLLFYFHIFDAVSQFPGCFALIQDDPEGAYLS